MFSSRYITVFKKEKSTIVARDATLDLSDESRRVLIGLLTWCPVTSRDKVEVMACRPTLGRLGGGVPQKVLRTPPDWYGCVNS